MNRATSRTEETRFIRIGIQSEIDRLQGQLRALDGSATTDRTGNGRRGAAVKPRKRRMSAEAKRRISDATKARWARQRAAQANGNGESAVGNAEGNAEGDNASPNEAVDALNSAVEAATASSTGKKRGGKKQGGKRRAKQ